MAHSSEILDHIQNPNLIYPEEQIRIMNEEYF